MGRKAELILLAKKQGWYDGAAGNEINIPAKRVMGPFANGYEDHIDKHEEEAYLSAYEEGINSPNGAVNPYATKR